VIILNGPSINVAKIKPTVPGTIVIKPTSTAKADLETMGKQVAQITTSCVENNIEVIDIILTFGTTKDISKRVKALIEHKEVKLLLLYTAKQIAESEQEYKDFVADMRDWYGLRVMCYR
jgi:hypothetical protein